MVNLYLIVINSSAPQWRAFCWYTYFMSRSFVLSNGELCVALDHHGLVRDLYYPHVGLEDHVRGHYIHRIGVWVDGQMS